MESIIDNLITATGKTINCKYVATNGVDAAFIRVVGISISDAANIFSDSNETVEMRWKQYTLRGYTRLYRLAVEGDTIVAHMGMQE